SQTLHQGIRGLEPFFIAHKSFSKIPLCVYILTDDTKLDLTAETLRFLNPTKTIHIFHAWDVVPYDRASPNKEIMAERVQVFDMLSTGISGHAILLTTITALTQKIPPLDRINSLTTVLKSGQTLDLASLQEQLLLKGYRRVEVVREPSEYSIRGSIIDIFPAGESDPYRLDLFGDVIEFIKRFDPTTQRSGNAVDQFSLSNTSELLLSEETIKNFRQNFVELFGSSATKSDLYQAISAKQSTIGMEHLLPLFHQKMQTVFDMLPSDCVIFLDEQWQASLDARSDLIQTHFKARLTDSPTTRASINPYFAVPPTLMFLDADTFKEKIDQFSHFTFDRFHPDASKATTFKEGILTLTPKFSDQKDSEHLHQNVGSYIRNKNAQNKTVILAVTSSSAEASLIQGLKTQNLSPVLADTISIIDASQNGLYICPLSLEQGFETSTCIFLTEEDIFGEKQARPYKRKKKSSLFIKTFQSLSLGDYVVHRDHGIGRYDGLITLMINNLPHDCLCVIYSNDDKIFVPVENLEVLTRYGSDDTSVQLDRLGIASWQTRKARVKKNLLAIANHLVKIAAERKAQQGPICHPLSGLYDVFCGKFPYVETEDQMRAIEECLSDLESGTPMDRLICGDVGFGKTEVAMRATAVVALQGYQVALISPTTLLSHQHNKNFQERFDGFALKIEQLSRLTPKSAIPLIHKEIEAGRTSIIIGTHSIFNDSLKFNNLGLVIIDEEQHFGVKQKEKLKTLYPNIHVLTLSATPIPRTLQLSLSGVRDLSIIATPPVDRMAVNTFVLPFDDLIIKEALMREKFRQGQSFYVSPRIEYLTTLYEKLQTLTPELKIAVAHGQMPPKQLEKIMLAFHNQEYDVLLATNIIESGLDIPRVNTIIIDRSDLFGLSQLYQLRGRVGRSKTRAYAYLTIPPQKLLSDKSLKRLEVMQTLDTLGAGFQLASYDMDIRGAGNILGEEQSGHIKEVGVELYQQLLEEAVNEIQHADSPNKQAFEQWTPQLNLNLPVLIPDSYVTDLSSRLELYQHIAQIQEVDEIEDLHVELLDRYGQIPETFLNLLSIIDLKVLSKKAHVDKVDMGQKGVIISFYKNLFPRPEKLIHHIQSHHGIMRLRQDHRLVVITHWLTHEDKMKGLRQILSELRALVES
ncbi:MAG: transcription-repair coupling factor, partial [Alphaproteobacteria bacterium]|nr:transcription-repair coupling factor [Alphaproteobacteria bacterium]